MTLNKIDDLLALGPVRGARALDAALIVPGNDMV